MRLRHRISAFTIALPIAGILATAQSGPPAAALPSPVTGAVRPIDSPAPDGSAQPNLASDRRGRVWLTWLEPRQTGGGHRFRAAQLTGNRWTEPVTIAEGTNFLANWADFPSLFVASDGTIAAHWLERGDRHASAYFVRVRTSKDAGRYVDEPTITPHQDHVGHRARLRVVLRCARWRRRHWCGSTDVRCRRPRRAGTYGRHDVAVHGHSQGRAGRGDR